MSTPFIQLSKDECKYLIDLINEMDSDTAYTARQRAYTLPKLLGIYKDTFDRKLFYQDVNYLLELIEDDEYDSPIKLKVCRTLLAIQELQSERLNEQANIDEQRAKRRLKRRA